MNPRQSNCLIASQPCGLIDRMRIKPAKLKVGFSPNDKEGIKQIQEIKAIKIKITTIQDIEKHRFRNEFIQDINIMDLPISDFDEYRDRA